jgi:hypothetical protein
MVGVDVADLDRCGPAPFDLCTKLGEYPIRKLRISTRATDAIVTGERAIVIQQLFDERGICQRLELCHIQMNAK